MQLAAGCADVERTASCMLVSRHSISFVWTITSSLAFVFQNFWLPGLFILPIAVMQMLILCSLGTLIELKSDQFKDQLYDIAWPEMDLPEQGMFKYVLKSAQQPKQLTCGRFAVINMNLFLAVCMRCVGMADGSR